MNLPGAATESATQVSSSQIANATSTNTTPTNTTITLPSPTTPLNTTIHPVTPTTLPAYRRLITSLLPVRYQDTYYAETIANPTSSSLALCALWHDPSTTPRPSSSTAREATGQVVAGIQCRLEPLASPSSPPPSSKISPGNGHIQRHPPVSPLPPPPPPPPQQQHQLRPDDRPRKHNLYISTLCTLAPHRGRGIATALLEQVMHTVLTHQEYTGLTVVGVYAHVWEANEEALEWYAKRGFVVEPGVVEGYYRRLRPSGGRVVRRKVGVGDYLRVRREEDWVGGSGSDGGGERGELGGRGEEGEEGEA